MKLLTIYLTTPKIYLDFDSHQSWHTYLKSQISYIFIRRPQYWQNLGNVKSKVEISSIFVVLKKKYSNFEKFTNPILMV